MAVVNACELPENLLYDIEREVWARLQADGLLTLGMTDPAQTRAGKIVHIRARPAGKLLARGQSAATVESSKWVGSFPMPVGGEIVGVNPALARDASLINKDTYGAGWIVKVRASDPREVAELVTGRTAAERYGALIRERKLVCVRCAE